MYLEIFALFGGIILLLFLFAEFTRQSILGVFASVLMLILSFWILTEGLYYQTGTSQFGTDITAQIENTTANNTNNITLTNTIKTISLSRNMTTINTYAPIPTTRFIKLDFLLGFSMLLLAIYSLFRYVSTDPGK